MFPKRPFPDGGGEDDEQGPKRFKNSVRDIFGNFSMEDFVSKMEPYLRIIVRETVEETVLRVFQQSSRHSSSNQPESSARRGFLLHFLDQLPSTIFTNSKVETEEGNPIWVILLDANTKLPIKSGPLSSMKVEIVALDGDFGSDDQEEWNENEFASKIIRERDGRRPLVTGELTVTLKDGVGKIGDVSFTDNSSWIRCRKFRLGAVPLQKRCGDVRVREARSGAFVVKDQRGESYKKHYPPQQNDDIWRLERIAKEGAYHKRLAANGIHIVKEFVQLLTVDPTRLRGMFDGISNRTWDTIIAHAATCAADDNELYLYDVPGQAIALLFDSMYRLLGATFDGQNYERVHDLKPHQMAILESLKRQAYKNPDSFIPINAHAVLGPSKPLTIMPPEPFDDPNIGLPQLGLSDARQDQPQMQLDFNDLSTSTSCTFDVGTSSQFDVKLGQQTTNPMQTFPSNLRNSFKLGDLIPLLYPGEANCATGYSQWPLVTSATPMTTEDLSQAQASDWPSVNTATWGQGADAFFLTSSGNGVITSHPSSGLHVSRIKKPREEWFKLKVALKLGSFMRDVAARRQVFCVNY